MTLNWKVGGVLLGLVFFAAVLLTKPIGMSTEFVVADGILWNALQPGLVEGSTSTNAYLASSNGEMAKAVSSPLNYGIVFVLATLVGGAISALTRGAHRDRSRHLPALWTANFGGSTGKRLVAAFVGGIVVLYGARLAGGCTSGHMMSGMMQTSISGYLFALGAFAVAVPMAMALYRKEGQR